jgi:hypothetical protein
MTIQPSHKKHIQAVLEGYSYRTRDESEYKGDSHIIRLDCTEGGCDAFVGLCGRHTRHRIEELFYLRSILKHNHPPSTEVLEYDDLIKR